MSIRIRFILCSMVVGWIALLTVSLYIIPLILEQARAETLVVAAWGDIVDPEIVRAFEQETGIRVTMSYYASNEELLVKLASTQGKGYDIIIPSDYIIPELIQRGLLHTLDYTRLNFLDRLCPELLGLWCDPANRYALPWSWEPYVIAYNQDHITHEQADISGWDLIFKPTHTLVMVNDALEMMLMAGVYSVGHDGPYSDSERRVIIDLLRRQRPWVTAYADARGDYFVKTGQADVVVGSSSYVMRALEHAPHIAWSIPRDKTFVTVEHFALIATSKKHAQSYQFLNYLYDVRSVRAHYTKYGTLPATGELKFDYQAGPVRDLFCQALAKFSSFLFFKPSIKRMILNQMWLTVKS